MTTLYIVRHGQYSTPTGIIPYRLPGFHLAPEGIIQAQKVAEQLKTEPIVAIYTSPMERTQETAQILAIPHNLTPVVDQRLLETRSPAQGLTEAAIKAIHPYDWSVYDSDWYKENNAETLPEISTRLMSIIEEKKKTHDGQSFVFVTHGDLIMLAGAYYTYGNFEIKTVLSMPYVRMAGGFKITFGERGEVACVSL